MFLCKLHVVVYNKPYILSNESIQVHSYENDISGSFDVAFKEVAKFTVKFSFTDLDSKVTVSPPSIEGSQIEIAQEHFSSVQGSVLNGNIRFYTMPSAREYNTIVNSLVYKFSMAKNV